MRKFYNNLIFIKYLIDRISNNLFKKVISYIMKQGCEIKFIPTTFFTILFFSLPNGKKIHPFTFPPFQPNINNETQHY